MTLTGSGDGTAQIGSVTETLTGIENLTGGSGGDTLTGDAAANVLDGGDGDDTLTGGADADVFVFADDDGADFVTDFENGSDTIDLSAVDDVSRFRDLDITDTGSSVLIDYGSGTIELDDVATPHPSAAATSSSVDDIRLCAGRPGNPLSEAHSA